MSSSNKKSTNKTPVWKKNEYFHYSNSLLDAIMRTKPPNLSNGDNIPVKIKTKPQKFSTKIDLTPNQKIKPQNFGNRAASLHTLLNKVLNSMDEERFNDFNSKYSKNLNAKQNNTVYSTMNAFLNQVMTSMEQKIKNRRKNTQISSENSSKIKDKSSAIPKKPLKINLEACLSPKTAKASSTDQNAEKLKKANVNKPLTAPPVLKKNLLNDLPQFAETARIGKKMFTVIKNFDIKNAEKLSDFHQVDKSRSALNKLKKISKKSDKISSYSNKIEYEARYNPKTSVTNIKVPKTTKDEVENDKSGKTSCIIVERSLVDKIKKIKTENDKFSSESTKLETKLSKNNKDGSSSDPEMVSFEHETSKDISYKISDDNTSFYSSCTGLKNSKKKSKKFRKSTKIKQPCITSAINDRSKKDMVKVDDHTSTTILSTDTVKKIDQSASTNNETIIKFESIGINSDFNMCHDRAKCSSVSIDASSTTDKLFTEPTSLIKRSILAVEDILKTINDISEELNQYNDENLESPDFREQLLSITTDKISKTYMNVNDNELTESNHCAISELVKKIRQNLREKTKLDERDSLLSSPRKSMEVQTYITLSDKISIEAKGDISKNLREHLALTAHETDVKWNKKTSKLLNESNSEDFNPSSMHLTEGNLMWIKRPSDSSFQSENNLVNKDKKENCMNNLANIVKPKRRSKSRKKLSRPQSATIYSLQERTKNIHFSQETNRFKNVLESLKQKTMEVLTKTDVKIENSTEETCDEKNANQADVDSHNENCDEKNDVFECISLSKTDANPSLESLQIKKWCIFRKKFPELMLDSPNDKKKYLDKCRDVLIQKLNGCEDNITKEDKFNHEDNIKEFDPKWITTNADINCYKNSQFNEETDSTCNSWYNFIRRKE